MGERWWMIVRFRVGGSLGGAMNGVVFGSDDTRILIDNCERGGLDENNCGRDVGH